MHYSLYQYNSNNGAVEWSSIQDRCNSMTILVMLHCSLGATSYICNCNRNSFAGVSYGQEFVSCNYPNLDMHVDFWTCDNYVHGAASLQWISTGIVKIRLDSPSLLLVFLLVRLWTEFSFHILYGTHNKRENKDIEGKGDEGIVWITCIELLYVLNGLQVN